MRLIATRRRKITVLLLLAMVLIGVTSQVEAADGIRPATGNAIPGERLFLIFE